MYLYNRLEDFRNDDSGTFTPSPNSMSSDRTGAATVPKRSFTTTSVFIGVFFRFNYLYGEQSPRQRIYHPVVYCLLQCNDNNTREPVSVVFFFCNIIITTTSGYCSVVLSHTLSIFFKPITDYFCFCLFQVSTFQYSVGCRPRR